MDHTVSQAHLVVGGGVSGLVAAWILARRTGEEVALVERSAEVGGLLSGFQDPERGRFDQGMHTFTSSGVAELDDLMFELYPRSEWSIMEGSRRDVSGLYFHGELQKHCHYFDLRSLPEPLFKRCLGDFFSSLTPMGAKKAPSNMREYALSRFGPLIAETCLFPAMQKLYGLSADSIDPIAAQIFPLDRINLFSEETFVELMASDLLRSRLAYPEQRSLPMKFASNRYSLYPKRYGAHQLVDALVSQLKRHSVRLFRSSQVRDLEVDGRRVGRLTVETPEGPVTFVRPRSVLWTCGIASLAGHLGLPSRGRSFQSTKKPAAASLLVKKKPEVGDLHYFWCFDPEFQSYRLTFYHNFTSIDALGGLFPVGMEFVLNPDFQGGRRVLMDLAVGELRKYGLIQGEDEIAFATGDILPTGFPCYSTANKALLETLLGELRQRSVGNLHLSGIQAEWGLIYQPDVLAHAYKTVQSILKSEEAES